MRIWTQFLCAAVTLMAAADGHLIPAPLETGELLLTPLVGSTDKMDREEQMMAVVEGEKDDGEMERHMEGEMGRDVGADMLVEGGGVHMEGENVVLQTEEATDMQEGENELVEKNEALLEEQWEGAEEEMRSGGCPSGWKQYRGRCFIYRSTTRTWGEAERDCIYMEGHLASIHSNAEYYAVQDEIRKQTHSFPITWIGGHDASKQRIWLYSDGTRFDYPNWTKGQPDNHRGQYCVAMNFGDSKGMDDDWCHVKRPSVCAK